MANGIAKERSSTLTANACSGSDSVVEQSTTNSDRNFVSQNQQQLVNGQHRQHNSKEGRDFTCISRDSSSVQSADTPLSPEFCVEDPATASEAPTTAAACATTRLPCELSEPHKHMQVRSPQKGRDRGKNGKKSCNTESEKVQYRGWFSSCILEGGTMPRCHSQFRKFVTVEKIRRIR